MGIQMRNDGTGIYYKPGFVLSRDTQIIADIGFHIGSPFKISNYYGYEYQNRSIDMIILAGYRKELLKGNVVGIFHPIITIQGGSSFEINNISWDNLRSSIIRYTIGAGFQFYNGRVLNEMLLKNEQLFSEDRSLSLQLSLYWR